MVFLFYCFYNNYYEVGSTISLFLYHSIDLLSEKSGFKRLNE